MTNRQKMLIFINIMITCIASSMLATALTTALPPIMEDFGLTIATGQWLTSGYSLAMGIMMPLTAFLITRFPTKRLYVTAIGLFIAGLLICVLAPSFPVMMVGRILQASGNGILTSMAQVILLTVFPEDKRGTIMGWYGLSVGAAPVIAPTLAGVLVDSFGWQYDILCGRGDHGSIFCVCADCIPGCPGDKDIRNSMCPLLDYERGSVWGRYPRNRKSQRTGNHKYGQLGHS